MNDAQNAAHSISSYFQGLQLPFCTFREVRRTRRSVCTAILLIFRYTARHIEISREKRGSRRSQSTQQSSSFFHVYNKKVAQIQLAPPHQCFMSVLLLSPITLVNQVRSSIGRQGADEREQGHLSMICIGEGERAKA